jgi:hypothetical protein
MRNESRDLENTTMPRRDLCEGALAHPVLTSGVLRGRVRGMRARGALVLMGDLMRSAPGLTGVGTVTITAKTCTERIKDPAAQEATPTRSHRVNAHTRHLPSLEQQACTLIHASQRLIQREHHEAERRPPARTPSQEPRQTWSDFGSVLPPAQPAHWRSAPTSTSASCMPTHS